MITRYGTAELYGHDFANLSPDRIRELSSANHKEMPCPFKPVEHGKPIRRCSKKGGVCSLRQYSKDESGNVAAAGLPVSTCPHRLLEGSLVVQWVGEVLLGNAQPVVLSELPFLMGEAEDEQEDIDALGMIDKVLVSLQGE